MKYSLITGPTSGIGFSFAKIFAQKNHNLILVGRNKEKMDKTIEEIKKINSEIEIKSFLVDLADSDSAQKIFDFTKKEKLEVEILVNNAGFGDIGPFYKGDLDRQMGMMQVNNATPVSLMRLFLDGMVKNKHGKILNVASIAAFFPGPQMGVYFATKSFLLSLSEAIGYELKDKNITVTTLCPGATKTEFFSGSEMASSNSKIKMASSDDVAMLGYESMISGKSVAVYGWENRLLVNIVKYLPRSVVLKIFGMMV
jgi:short-subunit dehydrogenase